MANHSRGKRRPRSASFTARFALILLGVGLATALAAGAVAWYETGSASSRQLVADGAGTAHLATRLLELDTFGSSAGYACQLARLTSSEQALAAPTSDLATLVRTYATAAPGDRVLILSVSGAVLAQAPTALSAAQLASLPAAVPEARCGSASVPGAFWRPAGSEVLGIGAAPVSSGSRRLGTIVVLSPVTTSSLEFARRLVGAAEPSAQLILESHGVVLLPALVAGRRQPIGSRLPEALAAVLAGSGQRGLLTLRGDRYAAAGVPLVSASGETVAELVAVQPTAPIGPTAGELAAPLALAVAAILLVGMLLVFLLAEHYLNRPLRRLNQAVQSLGQDGYSTPIDITGAEEVTRLSANFELMRRQLHRQLLMATGRSVISATIGSKVPLEQALGQVLNSLRDLLEVQMAMILVRPQAATGPGYLITTEIPGPPLEWSELEAGDGLVSRLLREPRFVARSLLAPSERGALERRLEIRDCLAEPLRSEGRDLGILILANKHRPYLEEDSALCEGVASQVVVAVEKSARLAATQREATTDAMTGLYNYRFLIGYLDQQVNVADRAGSSLSVLMLDLDHFKRVNDTHGHQAGDQVLRAFASLLIETIRKSDLAARYGGEEFVVVMANTGRDDAQLVAEKIRAAAAQHIVQLPDGDHLQVTVSVGGVTFPEGSRGARNLLDLADRALYAAKRGGRDRVEFLDVGAPEPSARS